MFNFRTTFITSENTKDKNIKKHIDSLGNYCKVTFFENKGKLSRQDYLKGLHETDCKEWVTVEKSKLKNGETKTTYKVSRKYRNDLACSEWIGENSETVIEVVPTLTESKVVTLRGIKTETLNAIRPKSEKSVDMSQVVTTEEVEETEETSKSKKRTKEEVLKNFADIWLNEFNSDLLDLIEFASSKEGQKVFDYSVEQKLKKA